MSIALAALRRIALVLALAVATSSLAAAQGTRIVDGRVMKPRGTEPDPFPIPGIMVTLHRVSRSGGRPIDSTRTDASGRYHFRYPAPADSSAIHFVSVAYAGITYFSAPLRDPVVRGADADMTVFDTTSRPMTITQRGRHIVVSAVDSAKRRGIIEVFELSNDSSVTRVAPPGSTTWEGGLPPHATGFRVGDGDISGDAVRTETGRVLVEAPIAPGLKQLSFSYDVPARDFPLSIPAEHRTDVLEVLVEEPSGTATGAGVSEVDPVEVDGRHFRRFIGRDVAPTAVVRIAIDRPPALPRRYYIMIVALALGAAMLVVLARTTWRRGTRGATIHGEPAWANDPDALARRIATLDAEFERNPSPSEEARETYELRRADLKARLADALVRRGRVE
ncbi:MAG: hypothetical protein HOQ09_01465 [Gemmatimonadaceae bacterium]|nr:hypothetical protein [Gemmatimonadaceae bacterium]